jgi:UDP-N-acetylglucosamine 2-epimerase (non-hydrolysing)
MATFVHVVGTRPNFMKMAPILTALGEQSPEHCQVLVHTGQHYDAAMSEIFFDELGLPQPDRYLGVGSADPGAQTAHVLEHVERVLVELEPTAVIVPGDVNSTLGAALAAAKRHIPVAHVEAGLRSFDRTMPEELNRVLVDQLADVLFTHSPEAHDHLAREGIAAERVYPVGNTMIDTLVRLRARAESSPVAAESPYLLVTLHRPALVDDPALLGQTMRALEAVARELPVVFPVHPRTRAKIERLGPDPSRVALLPPVGYLEFLALQGRADAVLTDSGGVQEETTYLGVPCFTLRDNTERPITVTQGTNVLLGLDPERIRGIPRLLAEDAGRRPDPIEGWDGHAGERIAAVLEDVYAPAPGPAGR